MTDDSMYRICMLGSFRLEVNGQTVAHLQLRKRDLLLAYVALTPGQTHRRDFLVDVMWPGKQATTGKNRLAETLFHLRALLRKAGFPDDTVVAGRFTLGLGPSVRTDVSEFEALVSAALAEPTSRGQLELAKRAVAVYGAGLLPQLDDDWLEPHKQRLAALHQQALLLTRSALRSVGTAATSTLIHELPDEVLAGAGALAFAGGVAGYATPTGLAPSLPRVTRVVGADLRRAAETRILQMALAAEDELGGPEGPVWNARLSAREPEIDAVLSSAIASGDATTACQLVGALWRHWFDIGACAKGADYGERTLAMDRTGVPAWNYAKALNATGVLHLYGGDVDGAAARLSEAAALAHDIGHPVSEAQALANLGVLANERGDVEEARDYYTRALARLPGTERPEVLGRILKNLGILERLAGNYEVARPYLEQRLALARSRHDFVAIAFALTDLAALEVNEGRMEEAADLASEALFFANESGNLKAGATACRFQGYVLAESGDFEGAAEQYDNSLFLARMRNDAWEERETLQYVAELEEKRAAAGA
jgi:tetratricopeptide (TPR) repeat protein